MRNAVGAGPRQPPSRSGLWSALGLTVLAMLLAACGPAGTAPGQPLWHSMPGRPQGAMTTGAALVGRAVYLAYLSSSGRLLVQRFGHPALAVPAGESAVAAPAVMLPPLAVLSDRLYVATGGGVLSLSPRQTFTPPLQIPRGTPPLSVVASGDALIFDEIATFDPRTRTELGPAAIVRLQPGAPLRTASLPQGLRPLPLPLSATAEAVYLLAADEPETGFYLLKVNSATLQSRIVARLPAGTRPLCVAATRGATLIVARSPAGRLLLWRDGRTSRLRLPGAATAQAAPVACAAASPATAYLALPTAPSGQTGAAPEAALWRVDLGSGAARRIALPPAPQRFTAAPSLTPTVRGVLAAWQGAYAFLR